MSKRSPESLDITESVAPAGAAAATQPTLVSPDDPRQLETTAVARDGTIIRIRPVRREDEPLLQDLATHMNPEDLRLRFFAPVRGLTPAVAARLSRLDYDHEMGLIAEHDGLILGVAHFFADADKRAAEYAISVRSDWQGHGVGYLLMTRLIELAAARGIGELFGEVLRENHGMLEMCHALGFSLAADPADWTLLQVRKTLQPHG
jgi:acetyltransferase